MSAVSRLHTAWPTLGTLLLLLAAGCASTQPSPASQASGPAQPGGTGQASNPAQPPGAASHEETALPLTMANLRGHKALYDEGWWIVTSGRDALRYAHDHGVVSAGEALAEAKRDAASRGTGLGERMGQGVAEGVETGTALSARGADTGGRIRRVATASAARQRDYGVEQLQRSWGFVTGGIYYGKRTPEHWAGFKATWSRYHQDLSQDFSDISEANRRLRERFHTRIEADWDGAWKQGTEAFQRRYEASGDEPNALVALGDLFAGYAKAFFVGVVKPTGRSVAVGTVATARGATTVFIPAADAVYFSGRTIQATGLSLYYASATTVDVLAPTVESGFLTGLGLLSLGSASATYLGGQGIGLANQVAVTGAAIGVGAAEAGAKVAAEAGKYAALVTYDLARGGTRVVINEVQSGVVLGYSLLSQLPFQTLIAAGDVVLLAYEGPQLALVKITGTPKSSAKTADAPKLSDLPVGTVVDLKKLKEEGVDVEVLSDDPDVTGQVLEHVQDDAEAP